uniref:TIL domain-containing protein n=1 Tax=Rhabditophanes sp. KR3021 TaxID=114890 RepID=A0AC35TT37_9BILA
MKHLIKRLVAVLIISACYISSNIIKIHSDHSDDGYHAKSYRTIRHHESRGSSSSSEEENGFKKCVGNLTYLENGKCENHCENEEIKCIEEHRFSDCYCINEYARNKNEECVLIKDCKDSEATVHKKKHNFSHKKHHHTHHHPVDEVDEHQCKGNKTFEECGPPRVSCSSVNDIREVTEEECLEPGCYCKKHYVYREPDSEDCILTEDCPIGTSCPENEVYERCGKNCERSCKNVMSKKHCENECTKKASCICSWDLGFVRNEDGDCIKFGDCPVFE